MAIEPVKIEQQVSVSPSQVYYAFTNATALREWISDFATTTPRPGGRIYLAWHGGFYACGEFTLLEPDQRVGFTWYGRGEPSPSQVRVELAPAEGGSLVRLEHAGLGEGPEWERIAENFRAYWRYGLENLASVLETGMDRRFTQRPMLGITFGDLNPEIAQKEGIPVHEGFRLDSVVPGMGAYKAGLASGDVIVAFDGKPMTNWASLQTVLQGHRAGDQVEVVYYRGNQKLQTTMELSARPLPEIPENAATLARLVAEKYSQQQTQLENMLHNVTEAEASALPGPGEWTVKEVLAHLILGERYNSFYITQLVEGQEHWSDDFGGNDPGQHRATANAYGSLMALLQEYKTNQTETIGTLAALPESFVARKGSYWRLAFNFLEKDYHFQGHMEQIQAVIDASRKAGGSA